MSKSSTNHVLRDKFHKPCPKCKAAMAEALERNVIMDQHGKGYMTGAVYVGKKGHSVGLRCHLNPTHRFATGDPAFITEYEKRWGEIPKQHDFEVLLSH